MALIYKNPNNIPFSGWIVSGKEKETLLRLLNKPSKSYLTTEKLKKIMAVEP